MTDCIDATVCINCGRTALFNGVLLVRVNQSGVGIWKCKFPCDAIKTKKAPGTRQSNKRVIITKFWTNSLLERISTQLSVRTSSLDQQGKPSKTLCPTHYNYDLMIPLVHASMEEPLGWVLFWAKYLHAAWAVEQLTERVTKELSKHTHVVTLSALVVSCYCTGDKFSGRKMRRYLDIGRNEQLVYRSAQDRLLSYFHVTEENYARLVKRWL